MVRCQVRGSIEPLVKALAAAGVTELLSREPSLEELFLAQYGETAMQADLGIRARITAPVGGRGSPGTVVAALSTRKAVRSGIVGLHLRHRYCLIGDQLRQALQDGSATRGIGRHLRPRARR